jgi:hypothetical protein
MNKPYLGPTVAEAAALRIKAINIQIEALQDEKKACQRRQIEYADSMMLESERIASKAEAFQAKPLGEE